MSSSQSKLRVAGALALLMTLALLISCRGFFVNPTLTTLSVGPVTPTIYAGNVNNNTVQMFAVGTFNDGSTSNSTPVSWSVSGTGSSGQAIATISTSGLVTAQSVGTGTVTATSNVIPTITGSQPLTVSVACTVAPVITATNGTTLDTNNATLNFTAACGGQDITAVGTWFSSNTSIATISAGLLTATQTTSGTFYITVTDNGLTSSQTSITASF